MNRGCQHLGWSRLKSDKTIWQLKWALLREKDVLQVRVTSSSCHCWLARTPARVKGPIMNDVRIGFRLLLTTILLVIGCDLQYNIHATSLYTLLPSPLPSAVGRSYMDDPQSRNKGFTSIIRVSHLLIKKLHKDSHCSALPFWMIAAPGITFTDYCPAAPFKVSEYPEWESRS